MSPVLFNPWCGFIDGATIAAERMSTSGSGYRRLDRERDESPRPSRVGGLAARLGLRPAVLASPAFLEMAGPFQSRPDPRPPQPTSAHGCAAPVRMVRGTEGSALTLTLFARPSRDSETTSHLLTAHSVRRSRSEVLPLVAPRFARPSRQRATRPGARLRACHAEPCDPGKGRLLPGGLKGRAAVA